MDLIEKREKAYRFALRWKLSEPEDFAQWCVLRWLEGLSLKQPLFYMMMEFFEQDSSRRGLKRRPIYYEDVEWAEVEFSNPDEYGVIINKLNLNEVDRGILWLLCVEDFTPEQIAELLQVHPHFIDLSLNEMKKKNDFLKSKFCLE